MHAAPAFDDLRWLSGGALARGSGPLWPLTTPIDETVLAQVRLAGAADADAALAAAQAAAPAAAALSIAERAAALEALAAMLEAEAHSLAGLVTLENGCPAAQAEALQVLSAAGVLRGFATLMARHVFEERRQALRGGETLVQKLPVGVAVGIVPWNVPLFLACAKLGAAVAAGCPIVLKPSPENALSTARFAELVAAAPLPAGMISVLCGDRDLGAALVADPRVAKVSFTGSTAAGRVVAQTCAERFARVTLELGGKSAAILLDDFDFDTAWPEFKRAVLQNNGQVCGLQARVLAPAHRLGEIAERLAAAYEALPLGDPRLAETEIGPLVNATQRDKVTAAIAAAEAAGARRIAGAGRRLPERGCYVAPTLFDRATPDMAIAREEVFGPVTVLIGYDTLEEAIALSNASPYGLSGSVWSADLGRALDVARRLKTGTVGVNTKRNLDFGSPFGGFRSSGMGRELGPEGIDSYLEWKTVLIPGGFH